MQLGIKSCRSVHVLGLQIATSLARYYNVHASFTGMTLAGVTGSFALASLSIGKAKLGTPSCILLASLFSAASCACMDVFVQAYTELCNALEAAGEPEGMRAHASKTAAQNATTRAAGSSSIVSNTWCLRCKLRNASHNDKVMSLVCACLAQLPSC